MPIPEPSRYRHSNLTKQQKQEHITALYGVTTVPEMTHEEIERMRQIVQLHDAQRKPLTIHDLNNPPREPYVFQKFPKVVYGDKNGKGVSKIVHSDAQLNAALDSGWSETPVQYADQPEESLSPAYQREAEQVQAQINEVKRRRAAKAELVA